MTDAAEIVALAERVEAATPPDRALDRDISDALGFGPDETWERPRSIPGVVKNMSEGSWLKNSRIRDSARWTASIDAAITLVPEGWAWKIADYRTPNCEGRVGTLYTVMAATPALALTAAALRARAALLSDRGEG